MDIHTWGICLPLDPGWSGPVSPDNCILTYMGRVGNITLVLIADSLPVPGEPAQPFQGALGITQNLTVFLVDAQTPLNFLRAKSWPGLPPVSAQGHQVEA